MVDPDAVLARYGLAPEPEPVPVAPLHTAAAERIRAGLVVDLDRAAASIAMLRVTVLCHPFHETAIGAHVEAIRTALAAASDGFIALGETLGCQGEA